MLGYGRSWWHEHRPLKIRLRSGVSAINKAMPLYTSMAEQVTSKSHSDRVGPRARLPCLARASLARAWRPISADSAADTGGSPGDVPPGGERTRRLSRRSRSFRSRQTLKDGRRVDDCILTKDTRKNAAESSGDIGCAPCSMPRHCAQASTLYHQWLPDGVASSDQIPRSRTARTHTPGPLYSRIQLPKSRFEYMS
jgi:hypothetical protein